MQDIFIRAVFGKRRSLSGGEESLPHPEPPQSEPVKIIHKEQDSIAAFTLNQVNYKNLVIYSANTGCGIQLTKISMCILNKYLFHSRGVHTV